MGKENAGKEIKRKMIRKQRKEEAKRWEKEIRRLDSKLDLIFWSSTRRLDAILIKNAEHKRADREISRQFKKLEKIKLTSDQGKVVDELLSAYNAENACCCRIFYKQGFKDCIALLKEIEVIS